MLFCQHLLIRCSDGMLELTPGCCAVYMFDLHLSLLELLAILVHTVVLNATQYLYGTIHSSH